MKQMKEAQHQAGGAEGRQMLDASNGGIEGDIAPESLPESLGTERDLLEKTGNHHANPGLERLIANTKLKLPRPFR